MNDIFDAVYCLNLARSTDRWATASAMFAELGVRVERVEAVDGAIVPRSELEAEKVIDPKAGQYRAGVYGLMATTARLWRRIAADPSLTWVLITEDDCVLHPSVADADYFRLVWSRVPADARMVYVGLMLNLGYHVSEREDIVPEFCEPVNWAVARLKRAIFGTHCYAIHREAVLYMLQHFVPFQCPVDNFATGPNMPTYVLKGPVDWDRGIPSTDGIRYFYGLASQRGVASTITNAGANHVVADANIQQSVGLRKAAAAVYRWLQQANWFNTQGKPLGANTSELASTVRSCAQQGMSFERLTFALALAARHWGYHTYQNEDKIVLSAYHSGAHAQSIDAALHQLDCAHTPQRERERIARNLRFAQHACMPASTFVLAPTEQYVTVALRSGLGNQLFIINAALAYARRTSRRLLLSAVPVHVENATPRPTYWTTLFHTLQVWGEPWWPQQPVHVHKEASELYAKIPGYDEYRHVRLEGFFQSHHYMLDRDAVRERFAPLRDVQRRVDALLDRARRSIEMDHTLPLVAVHVRRTDYKYAGILRPLPLAYYEQAYNAHFANRACALVVFSDDIAEARELLAPLTKRTRTAFVERAADDEHMADVVELYAMSQCTGGHIVANSSFSWWAAWLALPGAPVVLPKPWFANGAAHDLCVSGWHEQEYA